MHVTTTDLGKEGPARFAYPEKHDRFLILQRESDLGSGTRIVDTARHDGVGAQDDYIISRFAGVGYDRDIHSVGYPGFPVR